MNTFFKYMMVNIITIIILIKTIVRHANKLSFLVTGVFKRRDHNFDSFYAFFNSSEWLYV